MERKVKPGRLAAHWVSRSHRENNLRTNPNFVQQGGSWVHNVRTCSSARRESWFRLRKTGLDDGMSARLISRANRLQRRGGRQLEAAIELAGSGGGDFLQDAETGGFGAIVPDRFALQAEGAPFLDKEAPI